MTIMRQGFDSKKTYRHNTGHGYPATRRLRTSEGIAATVRGTALIHRNAELMPYVGTANPEDNIGRNVGSVVCDALQTA